MARIKKKNSNAEAYVKYKTKRRGGCLSFVFGFLMGIVFLVGSVAGSLFYVYNFVTVDDVQGLIGLEMEWGDGADWENMTASDIVQFVLGIGSEENGLTLSEAEETLGIIIPEEVNGVSTSSVLNPLLVNYTDYTNYLDIPLVELPNTLITLVNNADVEDTVFIASMFADLPEPIINISSEASIADVTFTTFMSDPESYIYDITMTEIANSLDIDLNSYEDGDMVAWLLDLNSTSTIGNLANDPDGFVNNTADTILADVTMQELNDIIGLTLDENLLFSYVSGLTVDYISANVTDVINSITVQDLMDSGFGDISDVLDTVDPTLTLGELASTDYIYGLTLQDLIDMGLFTTPSALPSLDTTISVDYLTSTDFTLLTLRDLDNKGLLDVDSGFFANMDETLTVQQLLELDMNVILNGIKVSDVIEEPVGGFTGIMVAVADFEILNLSTEIESIKVSDIIAEPVGGYTGVIGAIQNVTIANLETEIQALTIGDILGGVKEDYSDSILYSLYDLTITDIQDDAILQTQINNVTIGQTLGGVKEDYAGSIMYSLYDITIGNLQTEIDLLTIGEVLGETQEAYNGTLIYYIYDLTIADVSDPNSLALQTAVDGIILGDILGGEQSDYSGALSVLYNSTLGNLQTDMDALTIDELLNKDLSLEPGLLSVFHNKKISELEATLDGLTMGDVVAYPATPTGILALVPSTTLVSGLDTFTVDISTYTMQELEDLGIGITAPVGYENKTINEVFDMLP